MKQTIGLSKLKNCFLFILFIGKTINIELIKKYIGALKIARTLDIVKTDNLPIEIIDNVFIGSLGAAMNKKGLEEHKITHIIVAAQALKEYHPEVNKLICFLIANYLIKIFIFLFFPIKKD